MKNINYVAPVIELLEFQAEQGFAISQPAIEATIHNFNEGHDY